MIAACMDGLEHGELAPDLCLTTLLSNCKCDASAIECDERSRLRTSAEWQVSAEL